MWHPIATAATAEAESPAWVIANQGFPHAGHQLTKDFTTSPRDWISCVQDKGVPGRNNLNKEEVGSAIGSQV